MSVKDVAAFLWSIAALLLVSYWKGISRLDAVLVAGFAALLLIVMVLYDEWRHPASAGLIGHGEGITWPAAVTWTDPPESR